MYAGRWGGRLVRWIDEIKRGGYGGTNGRVGDAIQCSVEHVYGSWRAERATEEP